MPISLLLTQSLQNDFIKPLGRYEPLPNLLHIGHAESQRLMGQDSQTGPVATMMQWAYAQPDTTLHLIHIRDWHDARDPGQHTHLQQFGAHCLQSTPGADFAFVIPTGTKQPTVINSLTLNDFQGTLLAETLEPYRGQAIRVGLMGVWTEAKVTFLAYELATRYPEFELATCSALTASSSRSQHFISLEQLEKILGVQVFSSMGEFIGFLGGQTKAIPLFGGGQQPYPRLELENSPPLTPTDEQLIRYLFRDCQFVKLRCLDGGFSGNVVLGSQSTDLMGHEQVPHVIKIGPYDLIGKERQSFERVEAVMGNNAPRITEFVDWGERGALKYRYASMGGAFSTTFQKKYMQGWPQIKINQILSEVFTQQLGRLYAAATLEQLDLLTYYQFSPQWAPRIRQRLQDLLGASPLAPMLTLPGGIECPNLCLFYEQELATLPRQRMDSCFVAYIHGDLNGANIIIDDHENVWTIDFFHTHRGHILRDLIKLENDLLYIFTPITDEATFLEALKITDALLELVDLAQPLPTADEIDLQDFHLRRAWETIIYLRSFYPTLIKSDRDPLQFLIGQLRYAVHTLSFDESNQWQKMWALYTAGWGSTTICERLRRSQQLRIDWLPVADTQPGELGLTLLPGRRDYDRVLTDDIAVLLATGVKSVVCLLPVAELVTYGVESLLQQYHAAGLRVYHQPILDQKACSLETMKKMLEWLTAELAHGHRVVVHCVGGLGRSGMVAACFLKSRGYSSERAIAMVRETRSQRAIETHEQEAFTCQFIPQGFY